MLITCPGAPPHPPHGHACVAQHAFSLFLHFPLPPPTRRPPTKKEKRRKRRRRPGEERRNRWGGGGGEPPCVGDTQPAPCASWHGCADALMSCLWGWRDCLRCVGATGGRRRRNEEEEEEEEETKGDSALVPLALCCAWRRKRRRRRRRRRGRGACRLAKGLGHGHPYPHHTTRFVCVGVPWRRRRRRRTKPATLRNALQQHCCVGSSALQCPCLPLSCLKRGLFLPPCEREGRMAYRLLLHPTHPPTHPPTHTTTGPSYQNPASHHVVPHPYAHGPN